jgi:hypothetical protein
MLDLGKCQGLIVVFVVVMPRPRESSTGTYNVRQILHPYRIIASSSGPAPTLLVTHRITWRRKQKKNNQVALMLTCITHYRVALQFAGT